MPVFTIQSPDGRKIKIEAVDEATAIRGAQEYAGQSAPKKKVAGGFLPSLNAQIPLGDELVAGVYTALDLAKGKGKVDPSRGPIGGAINAFQNQFNANMGALREREANYKQVAPKRAALGRGLGLAAGAAIPTGQTANAFAQGSRAVNMARGATTAGLTAAGYAAADRGTVRERLSAASRASVDPLTLALGAAGGAIAPAAPRQAKPKLTETEEAAKILRERAKADPAAMRAKAESMRAAGVQPSAIDVTGEKGRRLVRAAGVKGDDAGEVLTANARMMSANTKPAAMSATRQLVSEERTAAQLAEELKAARDASATTRYGAFTNNAVQVPDDVRDMLRDASGRSIVARARADAIENQDWAGQVELDKLLQVTDGPLPRVSVGTLDRLTIAARERGAAFARGGRGYRARGAFQRQAQLNSTLDRVDGLKPARADYAAKSQALEVLDGAKRLDLFSTDPADYQAWLQRLSPEARQANQVAIRQEILDTLGGQRASTFGSLDELATSSYVRDNLRAAVGPEAADRYIGNLTNSLERTRNAGFVQPNAGSRTAILENDTANVAKGAIGATVDVARGNVVGIATRLVDWFASRGVSEQQAAALARESVDPAKLNELIKAVERQMGPKEAQSLLQALDRATTAPQVVTATSSARQQGAARLSRAAGAAGGQNAFAAGANP